MMQLQQLLRLASSLLLLLEMMVLITPALPQLPSQALLRLVHLIAPMALLPSATTVLVLVLSPQVLMFSQPGAPLEVPTPSAEPPWLPRKSQESELEDFSR